MLNKLIYYNISAAFTKILFIGLAFSCFAANAQLPPGYTDELVQSGYNTIMGTVFTDDGSKMFVWEKSGRVYVSNFDGTIYVKQTQPVLDISDEVGDWRDFGFLSFCLDPDFDNNGLVYMFYVVDRHHLMNFGTPDYNPNTNEYFAAAISRVTRYQVNLGTAPLTTDYNSRFVLLGESVATGVPLTHESHAGGTILFGDDGTLIVTTGDNASYNTTDTGSVSHTYYQQAISDGIMRPEENVGSFRSQQITSLCGKVLRLDPNTGDGISSNPFYEPSNPRSPKSRMYAMGLRNPFRMSIIKGSGSTDPADANPGTLFVADVGWFSWEDLHVFDKPGLNAGWPLYEGQTIMSNYWNANTINPDENNERFKDNCLQPTSFVDNPNSALRRFVHNRPEVAWRHGSNESRVPWFNGTTAISPRIGSANSPTSGVEFRGNTGVAGTYILGDALGSSMNSKYFLTDYVRNWIHVASLNDGSLNWFSDISLFAPTGFGQGIVQMMQNPLDGFVYYVNIFNGELRRITFDGPKWTNEPTDLSLECSEDLNVSTEFNNWLSVFSGTVGCGSSTLSNNSTGLISNCGNTIYEEVTFTLTDGCGNEISKTVTFEIIDTSAPTFIEALPVDTTVECDAIPTVETLSSTDNCGTASVTFNEVENAGTCLGEYTLVRTWTATDECGNETVHMQTITVVDTTAPTFVEALPADTTVECDAIPTFETLSSTDNCGTASVTFNEVENAGACSGAYTLVRTWTATDECGNETVHMQTITVVDTTAPTFVEALPADTTVECDAIPTAETLTASDNCGTASVTFNEVENAGTCLGEYTLVRTWTATDECGNETVHTQTITVQDTTAPTFVEALPADTTVECDAIPTFETLSSTDNCGTASVTFNEVENAGACSGAYTLVRTWTATDECGNETVHMQTITVVDTTAPTFVEALPADTTVECDAIPTAETYTASDNCGTASVIFSEVENAGTCLGEYTLVRTWTATDGCGNETAHTQTITVVDNTAPTWVNPPTSATIECSGTIFSQFNDWLNSFSGVDNCGTVTISHNSSGFILCGETVEVTFALQDTCGNNTILSANFTIEPTLYVLDQETQSISIYPNPTEKYFKIIGLKYQASVSIFNVTGQQILKKQVLNDENILIDVEAGLYLIKIETDGKTSVKRLIVK